MGVSQGLSALVIGLRDLIDLVLIISILLLVVIILRIIEKSFKIRLEIRKKDRNIFYKKEIKKIRDAKCSPEKSLDNLNIVARGFFKEAFDLPYHLEYLELLEEFKKAENCDCISFCSLISELNYSGDEIGMEKLSNLVSLLEKIMQDNRILTQEDKIYLGKNGSTELVHKISPPTKVPNISLPSSVQSQTNSYVQVKKRDINHINWRYKLKILLLKLRGRIPEIRKVKLEGQKPVS